MGWTSMKLRMRLKSLESQLKDEEKKKSSLQNSVKVSGLKKEIAEVEQKIKNAKDD